MSQRDRCGFLPSQLISSLSGRMQTLNGTPLNIEACLGGICLCFFAKAETKVDAETQKVMMHILVAATNHFVSELRFRTTAKEHSLASRLFVYTHILS